MSAAQHSALYRGVVTHRRRDATGHGFRYRLFWFYLDLDELPALTAPGGLLAPRWWWPVRYRRRDYLSPTDRPLADIARDEVGRVLGRRPDGPVRVLTQLCTFGYAFNPVSFYYCFAADGELAGVLAEITNTPWGERHRYVVAAGGRGARATFGKTFHISPFQPMEQTYDWEFAIPGERLGVTMQNRDGAAVVFAAALALERVALDAANLRRAWLRHPWATMKVIVAIHWNALLVRLKGARFHKHPRKRQATT